MKIPHHMEGSDLAGFSSGEMDNATLVTARDAEVDVAAAFLVEVMGEDVAAAFFARFGTVMAEVCRRAEDLAHAHRAEGESEIELPASQVRRAGPAWGDLPSETRRRIEVLAGQIERREEHAPIIVVKRPPAGTSQPYALVSGWNEFRAYVDVLGRVTVPVHVAPLVPPETLALFD